MEETELRSVVRQMRQTAVTLSLLSGQEKDHILHTLAGLLDRRKSDITEANGKDMERAVSGGMSEAMTDRLLLTEKRIHDMAVSVEKLTELPDPSGRILAEWTQPNGIHIIRKSVPFGVIAMIYESRPNVTVDAAALCLKSGNACVLRGGKEAHCTNRILTDIIQQALEQCGLSKNTVVSILDPDRELVHRLLEMRGDIDLVIPRGGAGLIRFVVDHSRIPVIETGTGVCHTYIDCSADLDKAVPIAVNAKTQRPSVCNAMETLLVHEKTAQAFLGKLFPILRARGVELRGDEKVRRLDPGTKAAAEKDWETEYNDMILSVKIVSSLDEAVRHIARYGTHHSECIVAEDPGAVKEFMDRVDAAAVYANASTRFTDGFEFGFGAEIGISTQKLHVRGPMGLDALTTYKYEIFGQGQIR